MKMCKRTFKLYQTARRRDKRILVCLHATNWFLMLDQFCKSLGKRDSQLGQIYIHSFRFECMTVRFKIFFRDFSDDCLSIMYFRFSNKKSRTRTRFSIFKVKTSHGQKRVEKHRHIPSSPFSNCHFKKSESNFLCYLVRLALTSKY